MKLQLSELDERLSVKLNKSFKTDGVNGIMSYGENNDYPQKIERIILGSVTANSVARAYSRFLIGNGFENEAINDIVVGKDFRQKKITIRGILENVCKSISFYNGAYLHLNIDLEGTVKKVSPVLFKNARFAKIDDAGYTSKIGLHGNWEKRKGESFRKEDVVWYNIFNLNQKAVLSQVEKSGGVENYKGQIYFHFLDNQFIYPLSSFDSAYIDADTEKELSYYRNNEIRNGFSKKTVFQTNEQLNQDSQDTLVDGIKNFMGSRGDKVLVISSEHDEFGNIIENKAVKIDNIEANIDSKLFEGWEKEITNKIRKPFTIPAMLIDYEDNKLGTTSGEAIIQATNFYNQITSDDRASVSEMFKEIFSKFDNDILRNNENWNIKPLQLYASNLG